MKKPINLEFFQIFIHFKNHWRKKEQTDLDDILAEGYFQN